MSKRVLIIGASGGLGSALKTYYKNNGVTVYSVSRDPLLKDDLFFDVNQPIRHLMKFIHEKSPNVIINCAGIGYVGPFDEVDLNDHLMLMDTNIRFTLELSHQIIAEWKRLENRGTLVNITSISGDAPYPYYASYGASKAFISHLGKSLDPETKPYGIRILTTNCGPLKTNFIRKATEYRYMKTAPLALCPNKAATLIAKQIRRGKRATTIGWRAKLTSVAHRWLPDPITNHFVVKTMRARMGKKT